MLDRNDGIAWSPSSDLASARIMLEALAAPYLDAREGGQFEIIGFDVNRKRGAVSPRHFPIGEVAALVAHATAINQTHGVGAYVGAGLRRGAPEAGRAKKEDVAGTRWLWLDFDDEGAAERGLDWLRRAGLPPTHLVTT